MELLEHLKLNMGFTLYFCWTALFNLYSAPILSVLHLSMLCCWNLTLVYGCSQFILPSFQERIWFRSVLYVKPRLTRHNCTVLHVITYLHIERKEVGGKTLLGIYSLDPQANGFISTPWLFKVTVRLYHMKTYLKDIFLDFMICWIIGQCCSLSCYNHFDATACSYSTISKQCRTVSVHLLYRLKNEKNEKMKKFIIDFLSFGWSLDNEEHCISAMNIFLFLSWYNRKFTVF